MKKMIYAVSAAAILICTSTVSFAQEKTQKKKEAQPMEATSVAVAAEQEPAMKMDPDMMMKKMMEYSTPGEFHKWLAKSTGTWMEEVTMWMDPSAPPMKNKATAENTMILGGRYQQSMSKGEFMGMPFEGISTVGYDNKKKMFVATWVDNMGTGITNLQGTFDKEKMAITFYGKMPDCMSDDPKKEVSIKEVFKIIDDNTQMMEWYENKDGKEVKTMEIKFTRKM